MSPRQPRTSLMQHSLFIFNEEAAADDVLKETLSYLSTQELFKLRNINKHTHKIALKIIFERRGATACLYQANIMTSWFRFDGISKDNSSLASINALFDNKLFTILSNCFLDPYGSYFHKKYCCEIMALCLWGSSNDFIFMDPVITEILMDSLERPSWYQRPKNQSLFYAGNVSPRIESSLYVPIDGMLEKNLSGLVGTLESSSRKKENTDLIKEILLLLGKVNNEHIIHHYLSKLIDCVPMKLLKSLHNIHDEDTRLILSSFSDILCKIKDKQLISSMVVKCINIINAIKPNTKMMMANNTISLVNRVATITKDANLVTNLATCLVRLAETHPNKNVKSHAGAIMREVASDHTEFPSLAILKHLFNHIKNETASVLEKKIIDDIKLVLKLALLVNGCKFRDKICKYLFLLIKERSFLSVMRGGITRWIRSDDIIINEYLFNFMELAARHQEYKKRKEIFNYFISKTEVECNDGNLFSLFFSIYNKGDSELLTLFLSRVVSGDNRLLFEKAGVLFRLLDLCADLPDRLKLIQFILTPTFELMRNRNGSLSDLFMNPLVVSAFAKTPEAPLSLITDTIPNSPDVKLIYLYRFLQNVKKGVFERPNFLPAIKSTYRPLIIELIEADYRSRQYDIPFSLPYHFQNLPEECFSSIFLEEWHDTILRVSHGNPPKDVPRYWLGRLEEDDAIAEMYEQVTEISDELKSKLFLIASFYLPEAECHRLIVESCLQIKVQQISDQTSELCIDAFFQRFRLHLLSRDKLDVNAFLEDIQEAASKRFKLG